jgi:hypothetical protein
MALVGLETIRMIIVRYSIKWQLLIISSSFNHFDNIKLGFRFGVCFIVVIEWIEYLDLIM